MFIVAIVRISDSSFVTGNVTVKQGINLDSTPLASQTMMTTSSRSTLCMTRIFETDPLLLSYIIPHSDL